MLRCGLSSVCYRNDSPEIIIAAAKKAGLAGIEWAADTHAPHGDLGRAETLMMSTLRAGLTVSAYGSYFRLGAKEPDSFKRILETSRHLQAPLIRIWGPQLNCEEPRPEALAAEARDLADATGNFGISLCLEPHSFTAFDSYERLAQFIRSLDHPFFKACWAPLPYRGETTNKDSGPKLLASELALVHVRNWTASFERRPLGEKPKAWAEAALILAAQASHSELDQWAILEHLEDEKPETLRREARTVTEVLSQNKDSPEN